jgi:hypothetical protein
VGLDPGIPTIDAYDFEILDLFKMQQLFFVLEQDIKEDG